MKVKTLTSQEISKLTMNQKHQLAIEMAKELGWKSVEKQLETQPMEWTIDECEEFLMKGKKMGEANLLTSLLDI